MTTKTKRIIYWVATILFAAFLLADGFAGVTQMQAGKDSLIQLGYPLYVLYIVGGAKLLGAIAILQTRYHTIKEWAFAGFAIDCLGAAASWYFVSGPGLFFFVSLVFLAIMFIPYYMWKKHWY
jgi:hypothetical protein